MDLLELGLGPGSRLLVDAAPLIYLVESGSRRGRAVEAFLARAEGLGCRFLVSAVAWSELLAGPLAAGDAALAARYRRLLADSPRFEVAPVDVAVAEEASAVMAASRSRGRPGLALADALHLATARVRGAAAILGNDAAWRGLPGCPPLFLVDELVFELGDEPSPHLSR